MNATHNDTTNCFTRKQPLQPTILKIQLFGRYESCSFEFKFKLYSGHMEKLLINKDLLLTPTVATRAQL